MYGPPTMPDPDPSTWCDVCCGFDNTTEYRSRYHETNMCERCYDEALYDDHVDAQIDYLREEAHAATDR